MSSVRIPETRSFKNARVSGRSPHWQPAGNRSTNLRRWTRASHRWSSALAAASMLGALPDAASGARP